MLSVLSTTELLRGLPTQRYPPFAQLAASKSKHRRKIGLVLRFVHPSTLAGESFECPTECRLYAPCVWPRCVDPGSVIPSPIFHDFDWFLAHKLYLSSHFSSSLFTLMLVDDLSGFRPPIFLPCDSFALLSLLFAPFHISISILVLINAFLNRKFNPKATKFKYLISLKALPFFRLL